MVTARLPGGTVVQASPQLLQASLINESPAPDRIAAARLCAGLTMAQAAAVVHRSNYRRWSEWENGHVPMPLAEWELFVMKAIPRKQWGTYFAQ